MNRFLRACILVVALGQCAQSQAAPAGEIPGVLPWHACDTLLKASGEDRWYFAKYDAEEAGVRNFQIPFASTPAFSEALRSCAAENRFPGHRPNSPRGYQIQEELFEYIPSVDQQSVPGRRKVWLALPDLAGLSGDLAIRIEASRSGEVLGKDLLFSTDDQLGRLVLPEIEKSLEILRPGEGPGPFVDVLRLKILNGSLSVLGQTHYMAKPKPSA